MNKFAIDPCIVCTIENCKTICPNKKVYEIAIGQGSSYKRFDYQLPKIKYADTNTFKKQLEHVLSEAWEIFKCIVFREDKFRVLEECMDLYQSLETLFRIAERDNFMMDYTKRKVIRKNRERGYYYEEG